MTETPSLEQSPTATCPRCGATPNPYWERRSPRYMPPDYTIEERGIWRSTKYVPKPEALSWGCGVCGFRWETRCCNATTTYNRTAV